LIAEGVTEGSPSYEPQSHYSSISAWLN